MHYCSQLQLLPPELHSLELDYGITEKRKLEVRVDTENL